MMADDDPTPQFSENSHPEPKSPTQQRTLSPGEPRSPLHFSPPASPSRLTFSPPSSPARLSFRCKRINITTRYVNADSVLVLTVKSGRDLCGDVADDDQPRLGMPNPYVNVFLSPDINVEYKRKTQVQMRTEDPDFAEQFKIPISRVDANRRLHIGVWSWGNGEQSDKFLGSTSFAVADVLPPAAPLEGWYQLFPKVEGSICNRRLSVSNRTSSALGGRSTNAPSNRLRSSSLESQLPVGRLYRADGNFGSGQSIASIGSVASDIFFANADVDGMFAGNERSFEEEKRIEAIEELLTHEKSYLEQLDTMNSVFVEPLNFDLTSSQHKNVFANFEQLHDLAMQFVERLEERKTNGEGSIETVGDLLLHHASKMMSAYMLYCANKQTAIITIKELLREKGDFVEFLSQAAAADSQADLNKYLMHPIHYLGSMPNCVNQILRFTPKSHEDHTNVRNSLLQFRKMLDTISGESRKLEALATMVDLEEHLIYPTGLQKVKLSMPGRSLLLQCKAGLTLKQKLFHGEANDNKEHAINIMLFTDMMFCTNDTSQRDKIVVTKPIYFGDSTIDPQRPEDHAFVVTAKKKEKYSFRFSSIAEKNKIIKLIQEPRKMDQGTLLRKPKKNYLMESMEKREVNIDTSQGGGLGFQLNELHPGHVAHVEPDSAASASGLADTDKILSINGTLVHGLTHTALLELIAEYRSGQLKLVVTRALQRLVIMRSEDGSLGFMIRGTHPTYTRSIKPGGPAEKVGMRLGDQIWAVNGVPCTEAPHSQVVSLIQSAGHAVEMLVKPTLRKITIPRAAQGWGFSLRQQAKGKPVFVNNVDPDSPAAAEGLKLADQIWQVNQKKVKGHSQRVVEKELSASAASCNLVVISTLRTVTLHPDPNGSYGFALQGSAPVRIGKVQPETPAGHFGIRAGDVIWEINGRNVTNSPHMEVVTLIRQYEGRVALTLALN